MTAVDAHPMRYTPEQREVERILTMRLIEKRLDGFTLAASLEILGALASLSPAATPVSEAEPVAWRLVDHEGDHWWGPSCSKEQADEAAAQNPDLILQPLYALVSGSREEQS